ncbi:MAG TPA: MotA/TolQ/ExbB proton channel family protein [Polyangia bacterium]|nr:MotA/TolQ/ExbB proton channel family protein [Polyangia bacterium]
MLVQKLLSIAQVGGQAVLYVLLALSVLSIGLVIERWWYFRKRRIDAAALGRKLVEHLRKDDIAGAQELLKRTPGVEAEVLREALDWYPDGYEAVEQVIAGGVKERRKGYEAGLLFLGTLGNNAPFIGLFGTVLGIVTAFRELAGAAGNSAGMNNVMGGIAEALVATAVGILVALPAVIAYNIFQKKTQDLEENVQSIGGLILAQMKSHRDGFHTKFPPARAAQNKRVEA